jgi:3-oxoacyl-[acyl-carrier protein] reductase
VDPIGGRGATHERGGSRVAVITGAAGGIGAAVVTRLLRAGLRVAATDLSIETLRRSPAGDAEDSVLRCFAFDVAEPDQVNTAARAIDEAFGRVDVLVTCAGIFDRTPALRPSADLIDRILSVNLQGALYCTAAFGPIMARGGSGRIIHISSVSAVTGAALAGAYAASKAGLVAATRSHARELARHGIAVNAILPGFCDTPMAASGRAMLERFTVPRVPLGRLAHPDEVAEVAEFLATCRTSYLTGATITIDGGLGIG